MANTNCPVWFSFSGCPVPIVLSRLSSPDCPVLAWPDSPVLALLLSVLFCLPCSDSFFLTVPILLSHSFCPILAVHFCLSSQVRPALGLFFKQSCAGSPWLAAVLAVLFYLCCSAYPAVLAVLFLVSCMASFLLGLFSACPLISSLP